MHPIGVCLWFDTQAEEAAEFYCSLFADSEITSKTRYVEDSHMPAGSVMTVQFVLNGTPFTALNGGPVFEFSSAISMVANCETQAEVDRLWDAFTAEGEEVQCGWVTDKFGVSWQVIPDGMGELLGSDDKEAARRATTAMLAMKKLDIDEMRRAFAGE
jgi:predicted 3-demethylubiquinone-9 3-methyltransferase (glyoxalase superfamily)